MTRGALGSSWIIGRGDAVVLENANDGRCGDRLELAPQLGAMGGGLVLAAAGSAVSMR